MATRDAYEVLHVHPRADPQVIKAAYRVLAAMFHPDHDPSPTAAQRMAELNAAYALVRDPEARRVYDRSRQAPAPPPSPIVQPAAANPPPGRRMGGPTVESPTIDFGRYAGWRLADLARTDPDYLRWLSRHSSGIRYRRQISELLNDVAIKPAAEAPKKNWRGR
jgi:curved DNA-binding protein CbpA